MEYVVAAARGLLGLVFLVSAVGKVSGRAAFMAFAASVRSLGVVTPRRARPVAGAVVVGEAAVCGLLATPARGAAAAGFLVAAGLLAAFTVGIVAAVRRGASTPCRCFGASTTPLGIPHVVRNVLLCAVAVTGACVVPRAAGAEPGGVLAVGAAGSLAGAVVTQLDRLLALFRPLPAAARAGASHTAHRSA
ncbi:MauE/DoxX family redox-associated membrane protein [Streptomyces sp. URMC 126]|uniref:MauE/DoxX family redox-associated membrane protein n=1 Tax=Streptomyces sp. URMC 126 TaxID=3423401 RepID=UPI003F1DAB68